MSNKNFSKFALNTLIALLAVQAVSNLLIPSVTSFAQLKDKEVAEVSEIATFNTPEINLIHLKGDWLKTPQRGDKIANGKYPITSPFGPRKSPGGIGSRFHRGVDVGAPSGTPLYAIGSNDEQVQVMCFSDKRGGNSVLIKAPILMKQDTSIIYHHMLQPCKSGTYTAGEQIGRVGSTGYSTGPHLHLGMLVNGEYRPPYDGLVEAALTGKVLKFDSPNLASASKVDDFEKVMDIILKFEGGCSDHPQDRGGRTYKGIIQSVAKANGWIGDICKMPMDKIMDIYRRQYWETSGASQYPWPLNLAIMNTTVNSGVGKAKQFLTEMPQEGTSQEKARWFVNRQTRLYRRIIANNPSQKVFEKGWMRRSTQMLNAIENKSVNW